MRDNACKSQEIQRVPNSICHPFDEISVNKTFQEHKGLDSTWKRYRRWQVIGPQLGMLPHVAHNRLKHKYDPCICPSKNKINSNWAQSPNFFHLEGLISKFFQLKHHRWRSSLCKQAKVTSVIIEGTLSSPRPSQNFSKSKMKTEGASGETPLGSYFKTLQSSLSSSINNLPSYSAVHQSKKFSIDVTRP